LELQKVILISIRILLVIAGASLAYLLFMFGHAEPEDIPQVRVLVVASLAGTAALIAGILQWVGLPAQGAEQTSKKTGKKHGK